MLRISGIGVRASAQALPAMPQVLPIGWPLQNSKLSCPRLCRAAILKLAQRRYIMHNGRRSTPCRLCKMRCVSMCRQKGVKAVIRYHSRNCCWRGHNDPRCCQAQGVEEAQSARSKLTRSRAPRQLPFLLAHLLPSEACTLQEAFPLISGNGPALPPAQSTALSEPMQAHPVLGVLKDLLRGRLL